MENENINSKILETEEKNKLEYTIEYAGENLTLSNCIELYALGICEDMMDGRRAKDVAQKCKVLHSLTRAAVAINP